jgi:hypothetical protein
MTFASIERLLRTWLPSRVGNVEVVAELPAQFEIPTSTTYTMPVVFVERISGANILENPYLDRAVVDVDSYGFTRAQAQDLAELVRSALMWQLPGEIVDGNVFTRTRTIVGPRALPHANPAVRRYTATYELALHPQA